MLTQGILPKTELMDNSIENIPNNTNTNEELGEWIIEVKIGSGGFGNIYRATNKNTGELGCIKRSIDFDNNKHIEYEYTLLKKINEYLRLKKLYGASYIPRLLVNTIMQDTDSKSYITMELLGPSINDLLKSCGKQFSFKTTLMLGDQMITCLQNLHNAGIVHRDIKPGNFVIGYSDTPTENQIYIIDFGCSHIYKDYDGNHILFRTGVPFTGNFMFSSVNAHFRVEQSRRDDLESLGYMLIFLIKHSLPWLISDNGYSKYELLHRIGELKETCDLNELCKGIPREFKSYMRIVRNIPFGSEPPYLYLQTLFRQCLIRKNYTYDYIYDWNI